MLPELARLRGDASKDGLRKGTFKKGGEQEGEGVLETGACRVSSPLEDRPREDINSTKEGSGDMASAMQEQVDAQEWSVPGLQRYLLVL